MQIVNRSAAREDSYSREFAVATMGLEYTKPGKTVGPCVRGKYIIHYVFDGKGSFNGVPLQRGSCFLICPNQLHKYDSDTDSPLKYGWISFLGQKAEMLLREVGLEPKNHVFDCPWIESAETIFSLLCKEHSAQPDIKRYLDGCFDLLMAFHLKAYQSAREGAHKKSLIKEHVRNAVGYINDHYHNKLSVNDVAAACYVSPHYLSNIFKEEIGISPQQYILKVRMKRAIELLSIDGLSISDVARSVGYPDVLAFSKIFHKTIGVSPRAYRERIRSEKQSRNSNIVLK